MRALIDPFILLLLASIVLAYAASAMGIDTQAWQMGRIGTVGIAGIFFLYGLKLDMRQLKSGLANWRLHLAVQASTFVIFPVLVLLAYPIAAGSQHELLWLSLYFMACLPSTVSSSVVMVSIAGGNIPSAIFNASISGIIGIAATPLLMQPFVEASGASPVLSQVGQGLFFQVLLPIAAGMSMRPLWGAWIDRRKKMLANYDKSVILLIVFNSFAQSFAQQVFAGIPAALFVGGAALVAALFFAAYGMLGILAHRMKLSHADATVLLFCGSKKSLVHGTVFSSLLFAGLPGAGLFLVPIMLYHAFQLIAVSILAQKRYRTPQTNH